jgi:7,8-dihydropterin-6-yl-methyl-4-(beta-D-ribofuranosyl)aminobenzene 5'-phosphate synthase
MRIVTLLEDESTKKELKAIHGLSLYIETKKHKILFDVGPNNYFIKNAKHLGVNLEEVDIVVISHGHNDHGNGLLKFMKLNRNATIYTSKFSFLEHVKIKGKDHINIGIKKPKQTNQVVLIKEDLVIDDELSILCKVPYEQQVITDQSLLTYENGHYVHDEFHHEIYLVIKENDNNVLFSGCSHKGIENIVDHIEKRTKNHLTHVFGGYHFSRYDSFNFKETDYLTHLGQKFNNRSNSQFYSCHCTGEDAFFQLKIHLKDKLHRLKTGDEIII